jgi:hypothetical protein
MFDSGLGKLLLSRSKSLPVREGVRFTRLSLSCRSQCTDTILRGHTHRPWKATFCKKSNLLVTVGEVNDFSCSDSQSTLLFSYTFLGPSLLAVGYNRPLLDVPCTPSGSIQRSRGQEHMERGSIRESCLDSVYLLKRESRSTVTDRFVTGHRRIRRGYSSLAIDAGTIPQGDFHS